MNITVIIPARYGSTRFPGKPLANIVGKPMIQHVYENISSSVSVNNVIVATDDERIEKVVKSFGGDCFRTSKEHNTGTDRIAEVAQTIDTDVIVNVQGDEPLISSDLIDELVSPFMDDERLSMSTLKTKIIDMKDIENPNVVKVITDKNNRAIYFSRSVLPYNRENIEFNYYKHIGIYAYRKSFLLDYVQLPYSKLENAESLEQLRAIENGFSIHVSEIDKVLIGVDTPDDIQAVEKYLKRGV
ncbi:3-deoxy-manno-octulosonate cytidylyltransferase [Metabacillus indicus]|uniref:3-deoxy-manno-octulosonate cytidylyltransferase n=1 Tax=Metabacillus indicus TaxID=246786 RepID=A0A084GXV2_METID|nr:3-deoxy-manno-octulosonate cytidylyltransferase [Metabacillus indicus]KEZ52164.1 3-deoxy-manno-octulosonate cytidylyltransferase [Metabacillus indicus]